RLDEAPCTKEIGREIFDALREVLGDDFVYTQRRRRISKTAWSMIGGLAVAWLVCFMILMGAASKARGEKVPRFESRTAAGARALGGFFGVQGGFLLTGFVTLLILAWIVVVVFFRAKIMVLKKRSD